MTKHVIGDTRYGPNAGPSWLVCDTDGTRLDAASPESLADLWVAHGGKAEKATTERALRRGHANPKAVCAFNGCVKWRHHKALVRGYCMAHGRAIAGIPRKQPGAKARELAA